MGISIPPQAIDLFFYDLVYCIVILYVFILLGCVSLQGSGSDAKWSAASELPSTRSLLYSGTSEQWTLWDQYKFKWFVPCIEVVLFKRFQSHYIDRGIKFGDLVLSIVERYLRRCPFSECLLREILL